MTKDIIFTCGPPGRPGGPGSPYKIQKKHSEVLIFNNFIKRLNSMKECFIVQFYSEVFV
jgi:hypothetical protein